MEKDIEVVNIKKITDAMPGGHSLREIYDGLYEITYKNSKIDENNQTVEEFITKIESSTSPEIQSYIEKYISYLKKEIINQNDKISSENLFKKILVFFGLLLSYLFLYIFVKKFPFSNDIVNEIFKNLGSTLLGGVAFGYGMFFYSFCKSYKSPKQKAVLEKLENNLVNIKKELNYCIKKGKKHNQTLTSSSKESQIHNPFLSKNVSKIPLVSNPDDIIEGEKRRTTSASKFEPDVPEYLKRNFVKPIKKPSNDESELPKKAPSPSNPNEKNDGEKPRSTSDSIKFHVDEPEIFRRKPVKPIKKPSSDESELPKKDDTPPSSENKIGNLTPTSNLKSIESYRIVSDKEIKKVSLPSNSDKKNEDEKMVFASDSMAFHVDEPEFFRRKNINNRRYQHNIELVDEKEISGRGR